MAVPTVGILKVALQHLREYAEIERLVKEGTETVPSVPAAPQ
jgi:hypothetical protein